MKHFPDNARVCFIGDSMTAANQVLPRIIDCYKKNLPNSNIRFFNCGTSGSTLFYSLKHFESDVLTNKPTHAVVAYGINDCRRSLLNQELDEAEKIEELEKAFDNYKNNLKQICSRLLENGVSVTVCAPPPYDEFAESETEALNGCNALMEKYAEFVRDFANKNDFRLVDYNAYLANEMRTQSLYCPDRVHPSELGYYYMAKCFAESQGLETEDFAPIPEYLSNWRSLVRTHRLLHAAEYNVIKEHDAPIEEKMEYIREYLKKEDITTYFKTVCENYLENKLREDEIITEISAAYEKDILNK